MSYLEQLIRQAMTNQPVGTDIGLPRGQAYASYSTPYEVQTPHQNIPNNYNLAATGFMANEFAYSIIMARASAKAQAQAFVYDNRGKEPEEMPTHEVRDLLIQPNQLIDESMFYQVKQIFQDIFGFSAWEIEKNKMGLPIRLWPMLGHYCSFLRGSQKMLRAIRYEPYGLPPMDIPIENILFFTDGEDFHPIYPQIQFISPLAHAFPHIQTDNAATAFIYDFWKHGAKFGGLLSVAQTIDETTANDYKRRFRDAHGGSSNWTDPLVLGLGAKYESMTLNFKDMAFPELDARVETRICNAFSIDPIVANAKAGLDVSSYNNKEQAEKGWFYKWVIPSWKSDARTMNAQLLPIYHEAEYKKFYFQFDLSEVYSIREDRDAQVKRAVDLYKNGLAKLNEARKEAVLDPLDDEEGEQFYKAPAPLGQQVDKDGKPVKPVDLKAQEEDDNLKKKKKQEAQDLEDEETKNFRAFAKRRIKEHKAADIPEFEFKSVPLDRAQALITQYAVIDTGADKVLEGIKSALDVLGRQPAALPNPQPINIQVHSYPVESPTVNIENKSSDVNMLPPTVTVINKVEPTPVKIENNVNVPKPKARSARLYHVGDDIIIDEK